MSSHVGLSDVTALCALRPSCSHSHWLVATALLAMMGVRGRGSRSAAMLLLGVVLAVLRTGAEAEEATAAAEKCEYNHGPPPGTPNSAARRSPRANLAPKTPKKEHVWTEEDNVKYAAISELNFLYNKYDILVSGDGLDKDPDSIDYETYPGGMRGFIDHIKQKYNHVDVKSPPRMSSAADAPVAEEAAASEPAAAAPRGRKKRAAKKKRAADAAAKSPSPPANKEKVWTEEENVKYAAISELNFLYRKYDILVSGDGLDLDPDSVDYETVGKNDEFCIKNEESCITCTSYSKNKELCIKNEELCI